MSERAVTRSVKVSPSPISLTSVSAQLAATEANLGDQIAVAQAALRHATPSKDLSAPPPAQVSRGMKVLAFGLVAWTLSAACSDPSGFVHAGYAVLTTALIIDSKAGLDVLPTLLEQFSLPDTFAAETDPKEVFPDWLALLLHLRDIFPSADPDVHSASSDSTFAIAMPSPASGGGSVSPATLKPTSPHHKSLPRFNGKGASFFTKIKKVFSKHCLTLWPP
jgi:hypothetical protein